MQPPFEFFEHSEDERIYLQFPGLKIQNSPAFYLILRGITGTLKLTQTYRKVTFVQGVDFLKLESQSSYQAEGLISSNEVSEDLKSGILDVIRIVRTKCKSDIHNILDYLSDGLTMEDLSRVLENKRLIRRNKDFFESLNNELCNFYYHFHKDNHTLAFLHLYRVLEYVSYSFPVIYASRTKDFAKSFNELKKLFAGDKDQGELKVFNTFIAHVLASEKDYNSLTIDINITANNEYNASKIYETIKKICDKSIFDEQSCIDGSKLVVKFPQFSSFIITVRNRFFHLKNSQDVNMKSTDIVDSDHFFSLINRQCAYFIGLIILSVISEAYFDRESLKH
ncbi:hypothetical protein F5984_19905 [Rudanella paleaurantiibacter]|uniref:Uncharacterized protein n=1 Tax=Rudanella paleaurantiibacter TaxID=2614655 RepID=A0A7J5TV47_9BACT|nr:hypothetical protein [Rudanella paleaurantiibacter]KAB7728022.1 hypothetical protein F5984_19905 [Rudanella paleaurantiibacter]